MSYIVPGMVHIRQTKKMACWYASAQMLIQWRRNQLRMTEEAFLDPSEDYASVKIWESNKGIVNRQILEFAQRLGLVAIPPMSPTESAIEQWLLHYGPLWVNGISHIVVIAGVRTGEVLVYDPAENGPPPEWRTLAGWYVGGAVDSRDTSSGVEAVFLHLPPTWMPPSPKPAIRTYVVRPGDTLSKIAQQYYGDAREWPVIHKANKAKVLDPNLIFPGQELIIPADNESVRFAR